MTSGQTRAQRRATRDRATKAGPETHGESLDLGRT
jgi:hypothetical protein